MSTNHGVPFTQIASAVSTPVAPVKDTSKPVPVKRGKSPSPHKDNVRELVETIVFVTVLVLLLKSFVAEAFVIPTGSMAETLLGYRKFATCPSCGYTFPVNCSNEVDPKNGAAPQPVTGCTCPNCRFHDVWKEGNRWVKEPPKAGTGDRVLVAKWPFQDFSRWDVVVFKYPVTPLENTVPLNFIKRLIGLPGETIVICNGEVYAAPPNSIDFPKQADGVRDLDMWKPDNAYRNVAPADEVFKTGKFELLRKPADQVMSMRRLVFDNDFQPNVKANDHRRIVIVPPDDREHPRNDDLADVMPPRWLPGPGWTANEATTFARTADADKDAWLRFQYLVVPGTNAGLDPKAHPEAGEPQFIRNFMGYNFADGQGGPSGEEDRHWVGDLVVECDVDVSAAAGEFVMELSKGANRFQARFDLANGECRLLRLGPTDVGAESASELARASTNLKGTGKHHVRFANVDEQLIVWVDRTLPFGKNGCQYEHGDRSISPKANDRQPASLGTNGSARLTVSHLQLWRDTYYTLPSPNPNFLPARDLAGIIQVHPGHYLCMGDNSTQSHDGRNWGLVPERLMQGRAVLVYFPIWPFAHRFGPIR